MCLQLRLVDESGSGKGTWFGNDVYGATGMNPSQVKEADVLGPAALELRTQSSKMDFLVRSMSRLPAKPAVEISDDFRWQEFWE